MRTGQFSQSTHAHRHKGQERSDGSGHKDVTRVIRGWLSESAPPHLSLSPGMGDPFDVIPFEVCP